MEEVRALQPTREGPSIGRKARLASPSRTRVSVVIPTLNEADCIARAVSRISAVLADFDHELIVVDDQSTDATAEIVAGLCDEFPQLRLIERTAPDCLTGAILDGFLASKGRIVAVVDADLQHDIRVLPAMIERAGKADIVVGSRYCVGGGSAGWSLVRHFSSRLTALLSKAATGLPLSDPLSGFFCMKRSAFLEVAAEVPRRGWKVLFEIVARRPGRSVVEIPYSFVSRIHGESKMSGTVAWEWGKQVIRLSFMRHWKKVCGTADDIQVYSGTAVSELK